MIKQLFGLAAQAIIRKGIARAPDFVIGTTENPYLLRWWLIPRNPVLNVYLHCFMRDDDDRALHDHPWPWCSVLLDGRYIEHTIAAGGIHRRELRQAPSIKVAGPKRAHRVELTKMDGFGGAPRPCWTLFITGPRMRSWGFHCEKGWVDWRKFTDPNDTGAIGRGCEAANDNAPALARKGVA